MTSNQRSATIDIFRGCTVALMVIVNSPGNDTPYPLLEHAAWHGCTLADLVFPFFLFIVGLSCSLSNPSIKYIIKRSLLLIGLGLFLNAFPNPIHFDHFRYYGILQRIGLCYLMMALLHRFSPLRIHLLCFFTIIIGYALLLQYNPTAPQQIDQWIFHSTHLYGKTFDPEGLLSTLPALATTLIGYFLGRFLLRSTPDTPKRLFSITGAALLLMILGYTGNAYHLPWNKTLWSSTYVLWTGGLALAVFACLYYIVEIKKNVSIFSPFTLLGQHALFVFVGHVISLKLQYFIKLSTPPVYLKTYLANRLFAFSSPELSALSYALAHLLIWWALCYCLFKRAAIK